MSPSATVSPADATTFHTLATISARISSAIGTLLVERSFRPSNHGSQSGRVRLRPARRLRSGRETCNEQEFTMAKKSRKKKARKKSAANHGKRPNS
ncbi:hypothetical protein Ato02nite_043570 [Paractinoplanes toevensis]|uniref:Uncharacterized protein n=1 Tax=Paractinoplanes toevensis TaxID=571911 RepID=A0A919TE94_9ACTN|nr:hypothetical protein Ato02nite_043570 [Actinoplanes toevensis]